MCGPILGKARIGRIVIDVWMPLVPSLTAEGSTASAPPAKKVGKVEGWRVEDSRDDFFWRTCSNCVTLRIPGWTLQWKGLNLYYVGFSFGVLKIAVVEGSGFLGQGDGKESLIQGSLEWFIYSEIFFLVLRILKGGWHCWHFTAWYLYVWQIHLQTQKMGEDKWEDYFEGNITGN